jgi:hypothetical protein
MPRSLWRACCGSSELRRLIITGINTGMVPSESTGGYQNWGRGMIVARRRRTGLLKRPLSRTLPKTDLLRKEENINVEAGEAFVKLWGELAMVSEKSWQTAWMRSKNNPLLLEDPISPQGGEAVLSMGPVARSAAATRVRHSLCCLCNVRA